MGGERIGGHLLVEALKAQGVEIAFGVPGESYLAVIDGLHDANSVKTVMCRQEGGAAMRPRPMAKSPAARACAWSPAGRARPTPAPACTSPFRIRRRWSCWSGRSPATRPSARLSRKSTIAGCMAKWPNGWPRSISPTASRNISAAFHTAMAGRPGPVVLALPEDMLRDAPPPPRPPISPMSSRPIPAPRTWPACAICWRPPNGRWRLSAAAPGTPRPRPISKPSPRPMACRSAPPSAVRIISTIATPIMSVMSALASRRPSAAWCATPICCWWLAPAWAR